METQKSDRVRWGLLPIQANSFSDEVSERLWVRLPPRPPLSVQRASSKRRSARKLAGGSNPFRLHHQILPVVIAHKNDPMPAREREGEKGESLDCSL